MLRGGILKSIGNFPELLRQRILVGIILVGRLGASAKIFHVWAKTPVQISISSYLVSELSSSLSFPSVILTPHLPSAAPSKSSSDALPLSLWPASPTSPLQARACGTGVLGGKDHVARHRELAPAAEREAVHGGDDGLPDARHAGPVRQHVLVPDIGVRRPRVHLLDVRAGRKGLACGGPCKRENDMYMRILLVRLRYAEVMIQISSMIVIIVIIKTIIIIVITIIIIVMCTYTYIYIYHR